MREVGAFKQTFGHNQVIIEPAVVSVALNLSLRL